jgi:hypothetical protein
MKTRWDPEFRDGQALFKALCFGAASIVLFSMILMLSPFLGPSTEAIYAGMDPAGGTSPSAFIREAAAAMTGNVPQAAANATAASDSRLENYQLERDSCCIGN